MFFNFLMLLSVLIYFANVKNVKEEFYIRKSVKDIFNRFEFTDDERN